MLSKMIVPQGLASIIQKQKQLPNRYYVPNKHCSPHYQRRATAHQKTKATDVQANSPFGATCSTNLLAASNLQTLICLPPNCPLAMTLSRRRFIAATSSLAASAIWSSRALGALKQNVKLLDQPFLHGVASGDPSPEGFVIWTRLAPKPIEGGGMPAEAVEVAWQVAEDEAMSRVVVKGTTVANSDWAHSVHVEVQGLKPDRWYWYQFKAAGETSPIGRARTTPPADSLPAALKFAFASCQHYEQGLFTAYEHMARENLHLVIHLV